MAQAFVPLNHHCLSFSTAQLPLCDSKERKICYILPCTVVKAIIYIYISVLIPTYMATSLTKIAYASVKWTHMCRSMAEEHGISIALFGSI